jgi:hypothetical protein
MDYFADTLEDKECVLEVSNMEYGKVKLYIAEMTWAIN